MKLLKHYIIEDNYTTTLGFSYYHQHPKSIGNQNLPSITLIKLTLAIHLSSHK